MYSLDDSSDSNEFIGAIQINLSIYLSIYDVFGASDSKYRHQWNETEQIAYERRVINGLDTQC